jgi:stage V sporulation protein B
MSLVPTVAMAWKQKDEEFLQSNIKLGLRTAMIAGFPCAVGLMVLAEPIMLLLYPFQRESALDAAPILLIMAFGVIFLSTVQTLTGVLQGIGKQLVPVGNLAMGAMVKIGVTWWLAGIYSVNVKGAAIGTVCAYMVAAILNILAVRRHTGTHFDLKMTFLKPGFSALVMGFAALGTYRMSYDFLGSNAFATVIAIGVGALVYVALLFLTRSVTREEVGKMPKGTKILALIDKFQRGKIT